MPGSDGLLRFLPGVSRLRNLDLEKRGNVRRGGKACYFALAVRTAIGPSYDGSLSGKIDNWCLKIGEEVAPQETQHCLI